MSGVEVIYNNGVEGDIIHTSSYDEDNYNDNYNESSDISNSNGNNLEYPITSYDNSNNNNNMIDKGIISKRNHTSSSSSSCHHKSHITMSTASESNSDRHLMMV